MCSRRVRRTAPAWSEEIDEHAATVQPADAFVRLVRRTAFASEYRSPFARGWATAAVQLGAASDSFSVAATDGLRLATAVARCPYDGPARTALVPADVVRTWARLARGTEPVRVALTDRLARFEAGGVSAWGATRPGAFPVWPGRVPEAPHEVVVPTARLLAELTAAVAVVRVRTARTVPVPGFVGPAVSVPLDGERLVQVVEAYRGEESVTIRYGTGTGPVLVCAGADFQTVLAPMIDRPKNVA